MGEGGGLKRDLGQVKATHTCNYEDPVSGG